MYTEKINFSTIEKLNLTEATEVFYEQGIAKKAYELLTKRLKNEEVNKNNIINYTIIERDSTKL